MCVWAHVKAMVVEAEAAVAAAVVWGAEKGIAL